MTNPLRWYVIEDGCIRYSCAERNREKAENFSLDYCNGKTVVTLAKNDEAALAFALGCTTLFPHQRSDA